MWKMPDDPWLYVSWDRRICVRLSRRWKIRDSRASAFGQTVIRKRRQGVKMYVSGSCRAWNMGRLSGKSKVLVSICRTVSEPDLHQIIQKSRFPAFRFRLLAVRKTFFTSFVRFCAEKFFSLSRDWKIIRLRLNVKYTVLECINSVYTVYLFILSHYLEAFFLFFS